MDIGDDSLMTALWINNPGFDTDHRHRHRGGMLTKTLPPTELQIPATVTTLTDITQLTSKPTFSHCMAYISESVINHVCRNVQWRKFTYQQQCIIRIYGASTSWTNGTKVPGPFHSWECKFQGANGPGFYWPIRSGERIGPGAKRL